MLKKPLLTKLDIINSAKGRVLHAMKKSDLGYEGFEEAYFSTIYPKCIKGWKRHKSMTLNLIVPLGKIRFVLYDDRDIENINTNSYILSCDKYFRLTIPPMIWVAFQSLHNKESILLNVSNLIHNPREADNIELEKINFDWSFVK